MSLCVSVCVKGREREERERQRDMKETREEVRERRERREGAAIGEMLDVEVK